MDVREKLVEIERAAEWFEKRAENTPMPMARKMFELAGETLREKANGVTVQEWISVKDRLPEIYDKEPDWSVTVLFRTIQGHIHSGYRNIGRPQKSFYDDDWTPPYWLDESENFTFEEDEVTHWQYLPQPPKGE